ncbi:DUF4064 domain-containing protein [Staphylococcus simiae]|uniref:DUF4064 domain-containing protein n=1 Tax=Staphylococcus simiae TaxID=308354 RepID=UPI001A9631A1|nr:DUF4064 domain-containing protein [Staphylococcus simiae]MBO1199333.1 DUF4064 domain-containing protein [Staphylococcus simiae]MBO1201566.1 DUF4064 domain-containing protein [Staphylococcus simiae]MBO1203687.1 DUF4064 domain-containing protein [Staphylococcus simiae]MBO1211348.1 DUF4064 domain-containing protein [Staphylococcus simiae]MBO1229947.1 DUF4064 domain-containing protein [Staphylococcus simiae]
MSEINQNNTYVKQTSRVAEMVLGIMGSIFGMLGGIFAMFFGSLASSLEAEGGNSVIGLGLAVIIVCVITLILSCIINKKRVLMGTLLIIGGILNIVFISLFGVLSGLLIIVAGILALIRK